MVAFDARMGYTLRRAARSGWIRSFMSGEALVAESTGPGDLWLQTRNLQALAGALFPLFSVAAAGPEDEPRQALRLTNPETT